MDLLTRPIDFCQLAIILECRSRLTMTHQRSCGEWARIVQPPSTCLEYEMGGGNEIGTRPTKPRIGGDAVNEVKIWQEFWKNKKEKATAKNEWELESSLKALAAD